MIEIRHGDCLEQLDHVKDRSVQLVCIDPPYNIGKDTWDTIENYIEGVGGKRIDILYVWWHAPRRSNPIILIIRQYFWNKK